MTQSKPWCDEKYLGILDQRKQAKLQWLQDPSQSNADNLNNVRREDIRHIRKKAEYMKVKLRVLKLIVR